MNITLSREEMDWLQAQVATGCFGSLQEAISSALSGLRAQDAIDDAWARPLVEEALEALDRGEGTPWINGEALAKVKARRRSGT